MDTFSKGLIWNKIGKEWMMNISFQEQILLNTSFLDKPDTEQEKEKEDEWFNLTPLKGLFVIISLNCSKNEDCKGDKCDTNKGLCVTGKLQFLIS